MCLVLSGQGIGVACGRAATSFRAHGVERLKEGLIRRYQNQYINISISIYIYILCLEAFKRAAFGLHVSDCAANPFLSLFKVENVGCWTPHIA